MQALLAEVHQLRQDLQTSAVAARKAQIVIYRLHVQEAVVVRAEDRLENAKSALAQMQRKYQVEQIKRFEEMRDRAENAQEQKRFEDTLAQFRSQMEAFESEEPELRTKESEGEEEFNIQQAKLNRLEDQLDQLDKTLGEFTLQASRSRN
jgi:predicted nuclease with TOPRIM domain